MNNRDATKLFRAIIRLETYLNSDEYEQYQERKAAHEAQKAQADKERYARECAAEAERKAAAAAGQLVDPLRADVIAELMHEGHTQEIAQNMTNTPQKLVALAQKYDFV